jgi:hypothetical protein
MAIVCLQSVSFARGWGREGGVLSPLLFAVFIDDMVDKEIKENVGCFISSACVSIILYTDDIILIASTISGSQRLLNLCENELVQLDIWINVKNLYSSD